MKNNLLYLLSFPLLLTITNSFATERAISIAGTTSGWAGSGVCFDAGDSITIMATGSVLHSDWDGKYHGPEGNPNSFCGNRCKPYSNKCNVAALVAKIGSSSVRCVGTAISGTINDTGELKFAINDSPVNDNDGEFNVMIKGGSLCGNGNSGNSW